jgi:hypothetical protein
VTAPSLRADTSGKAIGAVGGVLFLAFGLWAMIAPASFFDSVAAFEPYNEHFIRDIGAFQIGLGATLLLAALVTTDALTAALVGVGLGAAAHLVPHLVDLNAGGNPIVDIPSWVLFGLVLLIGGRLRWRRICGTPAGD